MWVKISGLGKHNLLKKTTSLWYLWSVILQQGFSQLRHGGKKKKKRHIWANMLHVCIEWKIRLIIKTCHLLCMLNPLVWAVRCSLLFSVSFIYSFILKLQHIIPWAMHRSDTCDIDMACMWCPHGVHVIPTRLTCDTHMMHMCYSHGFVLLFISYLHWVHIQRRI